MQQSMSFDLTIKKGSSETILSAIKDYFSKDCEFFSSASEKERFQEWASCLKYDEQRKTVTILSDNSVDPDIYPSIIRNMLYSIAESNPDFAFSGSYSLDNDEYASIPHYYEACEGKVSWNEVDDDMVGQINMYLEYMEYSIEQVVEETGLSEDMVKAIAKELGFRVD